MTDEIKEIKKPEEIAKEQKKIIAEARGRYVIVDGAKNYLFDFPANSTLIENYAILDYIKDQILAAMQDQKKKEEISKPKDVDKNAAFKK